MRPEHVKVGKVGQAWPMCWTRPANSGARSIPAEKGQGLEQSLEPVSNLEGIDHASRETQPVPGLWE